MKKGKEKKRVSVSTVILILILLAGICVLLYPTVSEWWNSLHASQAIAGYVEAVEDLSEKEKEAMFKAARKYNRSLPNGVNLSLTEEGYAQYEKLLDITGTGIMGYLQIPAINVNLPIYHGTDEGILQIAIGHIAGSSLPIGGKRTHAVLSGHRGLPSAKLLSDLDELKEGDIFTITVLDRVVTYQTDQIRIVLPEDTEELAIQEGQDLCTLITCTPYGINTHRILLRGHRIKNLNGDIAVAADAVRIPNYIVIPAIGIPLLFCMLAAMLIYYRRRGPIRSEREILEEMKKKE